MGNDARIDDTLWVSGWLIGYGNASVSYDLDVGDDLTVDDVLQVYGNTFVDDIFGDHAWFAYVKSTGGYDPPYVLYDRQTREQIIDLIRKEVIPGKEDGAALFFNRDTKRLETYVASEGKFYDLQGNVVHTLAKVEVGTTEFQTLYFLDDVTGTLTTRLKPVYDKYVVRDGFELDRNTGQFLNRDTGDVVPREEAVAMYAAKEGKYYDLQGNLIGSEPREAEIEYRTEYYFERLTGEVKVRREPVRDIYEIRKGFRFNDETGQFVDRLTGKAVPKEMAIELKKG